MTPTRRRDFAAEYRRRKARAAAAGTTVAEQRVERGERRGLSRAQALGHPAGNEPLARAVTGSRTRTATFFADNGERVVLRDATRVEIERASRQTRLMRALHEGRVSPAEFRRRMARLAPIRGQRLLSDPRVALAIAVTTEPDDIEFES